MPVWLRRFTFTTLKEYYDKQNSDDDELKPVNSTQRVSPPDTVQKAMTPTYSTKASNK